MKDLSKEKIVKEFGLFIREARESKGLYQSDVSAKIGVSRGYYAHLEAGDRDISFALAMKICHALGLDLNEFVKLMIK